MPAGNQKEVTEGDQDYEAQCKGSQRSDVNQQRQRMDTENNHLTSKEKVIGDNAAASTEKEENGAVMMSSNSNKKTAASSSTSEDEQLMEFSKPTCLTNLMVRRPCTIIITGYVFMLAISVLVAFMGWLEPNLPHDRDFLVWGDPYVSNMDKTTLVERMPISS